MTNYEDLINAINMIKVELNEVQKCINLGMKCEENDLFKVYHQLQNIHFDLHKKYHYYNDAK